jgi:3-oxoacyl-[acyl-carrier-protein] synthase II
MTRIVITGIGACTAVGDNAQCCFDSFLQGRAGNKPLIHLNKERFNTKIAYERADDINGNGMFRSGTFLIRALREAVNQACIDTNDNIPVYVGSGLREMRSAELAAINGERLELEDLDFAKAVRGILTESCNIYTISNACAASNYALALAYDSICLGRTDISIAAGCDTLTSSMFGLLDRVNPNMPESIQVFDSNRKGILMGDGGVAIVLERLESALRHGRTPMAELKGIGLSTDGVHETAPDQSGIERALYDAYAKSMVVPEDVDLIYVHGTGTILNDSTESKALSSIYHNISRKPALSGIKAMTGHTSGASGCIGVISAVKSLQLQVIPPTPGTTSPIEESKGFALYQEATNAELNLVQVNAFGFGGVNSVVMVAQYEQ